MSKIISNGVEYVPTGESRQAEQDDYFLWPEGDVGHWTVNYPSNGIYTILKKNEKKKEQPLPFKASLFDIVKGKSNIGVDIDWGIVLAVTDYEPDNGYYQVLFKDNCGVVAIHWAYGNELSLASVNHGVREKLLNEVERYSDAVQG